MLNYFTEKNLKKMPKRPEINLTREELNRAEIPINHVLIKITRRVEGLKTKAGVTVGFNTDEVYADGDDSHSANLAEIVGWVAKVPEKLYFNPDDNVSMDWETDMELEVGDQVWFSLLESKNSVQLMCEEVLYKSVPYQDIYVAKRMHFWRENSIIESGTAITTLNGYVLCEPCYEPKLSDLAHLSKDKVDMTRGVIKFIGSAPKAYLREAYCHIEDLRVEDEVLFDRRTPLFYLERMGYTGIFDDGKQYWIAMRRRIALVLNR